MIQVRAEHVSFVYPERGIRALDDVSFTVIKSLPKPSPPIRPSVPKTSEPHPAKSKNAAPNA